MSLGSPKRVSLFALLLASGAILLVVTVVMLPRMPTGLSYDGVQTYWVGGHSVTIETQSFSLEPASGDNGPAKIIISTEGRRTVLDSVYNNDFFTDIRPAYVSWQGVDDAHGRDLLIWKQDSISRELIAADYISSGDGQHHTLNPPQTTWP